MAPRGHVKPLASRVPDKYRRGPSPEQVRKSLEGKGYPRDPPKMQSTPGLPKPWRSSMKGVTSKAQRNDPSTGSGYPRPGAVSSSPVMHSQTNARGHFHEKAFASRPQQG